MIWGIFLAVLAALALLGRTRLGFRGTYTRQEVGVWFRLGAFQWRLYPWKKGKKPEKPKEAKQPPRPSKPEEPKPPILSPDGVFQLVRRLLPVALEGADAFRRRLQVDVLQLEIVSGGADPASAAERYGQINALLGAMDCGVLLLDASSAVSARAVTLFKLLRRPPCLSPPASSCGWACGTAPGV